MTLALGAQHPHLPSKALPAYSPLLPTSASAPPSPTSITSGSPSPRHLWKSCPVLVLCFWVLKLQGRKKRDVHWASAGGNGSFTRKTQSCSPGEMAQLLCRNQDPSYNLQRPHKHSGFGAYTYNPSTVVGIETEGSLGLVGCEPA